MTPSEFVAYASGSWRCVRGESIGRHWFNRLHQVRPDLADAVRGTPLDPFDKDYVPAEFVAFVYDSWDDPHLSP